MPSAKTNVSTHRTEVPHHLANCCDLAKAPIFCSSLRPDPGLRRGMHDRNRTVGAPDRTEEMRENGKRLVGDLRHRSPAAAAAGETMNSEEPSCRRGQVQRPDTSKVLAGDESKMA
jgi:hypothetical protein